MRPIPDFTRSIAHPRYRAPKGGIHVTLPLARRCERRPIGRHIVRTIPGFPADRHPIGGLGVYGQRSHVAGRGSHGVAHDHIESRSTVRGCCRWRGVARRSRACYVRPVLLPLVAQRRGACRSHAECRCLARGHRLVHRLRGDCRCHRSRVYRQRCCVAYCRASRVAHHYPIS